MFRPNRTIIHPHNASQTVYGLATLRSCKIRGNGRMNLELANELAATQSLQQYY
ncbi:MAG: hypothetical protein JWO43_662 [Candidatus Adlerbacteria bacterium]|nr:hypothetical protein [Candidatus Adlerbacteria bacterium]